MNKLLTFILGIGLLGACNAPSNVSQPSVAFQKMNGELILQDSTVASDSVIEKMILPYREELNKEMNSVITNMDVMVEGGRGESTLANFAADAFFNYVHAEVDSTVDFALLNSGGLRVNAIAKGPLTKAELISLLPFNNYVVIVTMEGKDVQKVFEYLAKRGGEPFANMAMDVYTGKYIVKVNGQPFDPNKSYKIATIDYLQRGGNDMSFFKYATHVQETNILLFDAVRGYLKTQENINTKLDGRFKQHAPYSTEY